MEMVMAPHSSPRDEAVPVENSREAESTEPATDPITESASAPTGTASNEVRPLRSTVGR